MDYAALAEAAASLIAEFGQAATVRRAVSLGYDPSLTITVDATGKTFTRSSGSWIVDGFLAGDTATFAGFADAGNNGAFVASTVAALVLTCSTATGLVNVSAASDVTATATHSDVCNVLERDVNSVALFASSLMPGSIISEANRFYMLAGATPSANDKLVIGSTEYTINAARPLSPGATVLYWVVRVQA